MLDPDSLRKKKEYVNFKVKLQFAPTCKDLKCLDTSNDHLCDKCCQSITQKEQENWKFIRKVIEQRTQNKLDNLLSSSMLAYGSGQND